MAETLLPQGRRRVSKIRSVIAAASGAAVVTISGCSSPEGVSPVEDAPEVVALAEEAAEDRAAVIAAVEVFVGALNAMPGRCGDLLLEEYKQTTIMSPAQYEECDAVTLGELNDLREIGADLDEAFAHMEQTSDDHSVPVAIAIALGAAVLGYGLGREVGGESSRPRELER